MKDYSKYQGIIPAFYACYDAQGDISPEGVRALAEVFGADFPARLKTAGEAEGVHDGYRFAVKVLQGAASGGVTHYAVHCLGPDAA